ncbi:UNKNOWN [Stylonychia lemnae]|uniref:Rhabdoid tumor deletion region protein 1 n=1 Tax=Stylonychia lemnae TaxID=5949 RepID=A0A078A146_STYLE|nr:UNKNOWN [Stylonychia lemnae]|eukprot:CDW75208.1 UNKNOWN [Stylonychia lemnae]
MEETLSNTRFISFHRNQTNPEPMPLSTLTFAYGDQKYEKMCREMAGKDDVLRRKVLIEINEDFHQADKLNFALESSILKQLVKCFTEKDNVIRELASRAVLKVACTEKGREILVNQQIVKDVRKLFDDQEIQIRNNAYTCLINLAQYTFGIDAVIDFEIVPVLVDKLILEKEEEILVLILQLMKILAEGEKAPVLLLNTPVLARLNTHLASRNQFIRELAALNLGSISYNVKGKEKTIEAKSIQPLTKMLFDDVSEVRTAATRALASLAQLKAGKVEIYDLEMLDRIIELLYDDSDQTKLNVVQMISAVGEYPPAREKFKECLEKLREIVIKDKFHFPLVSRFAQTAIDVITWIP